MKIRYLHLIAYIYFWTSLHIIFMLGKFELVEECYYSGGRY